MDAHEKRLKEKARAEPPANLDELTVRLAYTARPDALERIAQTITKDGSVNQAEALTLAKSLVHPEAVKAAKAMNCSKVELTEKLRTMLAVKAVLVHEAAKKKSKKQEAA